MKQVVIASKNPVKINAVKQAFLSAFPNTDFEFSGVSAISNVSDQPMTEQETLLGAQNRVKHAMQLVQEGDYFVGIEGGIEVINEDMLCFAWIVIADRNMAGKAKTATFVLPKQIKDLVLGGMELGDADDVVFKKQNSKQKNGAVGLLTNDMITRSSYYTHAAMLALIPFLNQKLY